MLFWEEDAGVSTGTLKLQPSLMLKWMLETGSMIVYTRNPRGVIKVNLWQKKNFQKCMFIGAVVGKCLSID